MTTTSKTTVNFYEGSDLFYSVSTNLNVDPDYIEMKLAKQYEHRPTTQFLWAIVSEDRNEIARYVFEYGVGLTDITVVN